MQRRERPGNIVEQAQQIVERSAVATLMRTDSYAYREAAVMAGRDAAEYLSDKGRVIIPDVKVAVGHPEAEHIGIYNGLLYQARRPYKIEVPQGLTQPQLETVVAHKLLHVVQAEKTLVRDRLLRGGQYLYMGASSIALGMPRQYKFGNRGTRRAVLEGEAALFAELFVTRRDSDPAARTQTVLTMLGANAEYVPLILRDMRVAVDSEKGDWHSPWFKEIVFNYVFGRICEFYDLTEPRNQSDMSRMYAIGRDYVPMFFGAVSFAMDGFDADKAVARAAHSSPGSTMRKMLAAISNKKKTELLIWSIEDALH